LNRKLVDEKKGMARGETDESGIQIAHGKQGQNQI
jgi:hypothetical protein